MPDDPRSAPRDDRRGPALALGAVLCLVLAGALWFRGGAERDLAAPPAGAAALLAVGAWRRPRRGVPRALAPLIAIVGCDGSGKSTLSSDIVRSGLFPGPVAVCYLGLGSGAMGERIKRWPLVGGAVEAYLARKAGQTRTKGAKIPGAATALVVFAFSLLRRRRFRRVLALRRTGVTVVTDRYPQVEVPGYYDGPGLAAASASGPLVAWLAARERRMYEAMARYRPDVVIRLNIDLETAYARKPDHTLDLLRAKVAATPRLRFNGARIVDLDSRRPYAEMRDAACAAIRETLARHDARAAAA